LGSLSGGRSPPPRKLIDEEDHRYINLVKDVIAKDFGSEDPEWFSAAETYLNTILELKAKEVPQMAKTFLQSLTRRLFTPESISKGQPVLKGPTPEGGSLSDFHYS
jgi:hypothetical protein